jgi:hypothetical protein
MDTQAERIAARFKEMSRLLDERQLRLFAAAEATAFGWGGVELLHKITGLARSTIKRGQDELAIAARPSGGEEPAAEETIGQSVVGGPPPGRARRPGGGRERIERHHPEWVEALETLVDPVTRGDAESSIRWTVKSTSTLSEELSRLGYDISSHTIGKKLHEIGYNLRSKQKMLSHSSYEDRNAQFEFINKSVTEQLLLNNPVISIDTKKREVLLNLKDQGKTGEIKGYGIKINGHNFPSPDFPRAIPYTRHEIHKNIGYMAIGTDHDTSELVANSIYGWWNLYGNAIYHNASKILITADPGGDNGYRVNLLKYSIQNLANKIQMPIIICHFPPGTSKWNKVEHKLFSYISLNWLGKSSIDYETEFKLISSAKNSSELPILCYFDYSKYQTDNKLINEQIESINIIKNNFNSDWNYTIFPHD